MDGVAMCSSTGWPKDTFLRKNLGLGCRSCWVWVHSDKGQPQWQRLCYKKCSQPPENIGSPPLSATVRPHLKYCVWGSPIQERNYRLPQVLVRITKMIKGLEHITWWGKTRLQPSLRQETKRRSYWFLQVGSICNRRKLIKQKLISIEGVYLWFFIIIILGACLFWTILVNKCSDRMWNLLSSETFKTPLDCRSRLLKIVWTHDLIF